MKLAALGLLALLASGVADARSHTLGGTHHPAAHAGPKHHSSTKGLGSSGHHGPKKASGVARDAHGKIKRSRAARDEFMREHPCPTTGKTHGKCPGYIIDHVQALKHGGSDVPGNMQWQTQEAAKAKDKVE